MVLGNYPTPVEPLHPTFAHRSHLWIKHDDATHPIYGGNKVRKLEGLLRDARQIQARRIVTFGAAGSHHVLATAIHGSSHGFPVAALLTPVPYSEHAQSNLRWSLQVGLTAYPCAHPSLIPFILPRILRQGDMLIPPGGSNASGSIGYALAARELESQVHAGLVPDPDVIVVALGSGGTVAGLLAGLEETSLRCVVHAVRVFPWPWINELSVLTLARSVARRRGTTPSWRSLRKRLWIVNDRLGRGYGYPTPWGERAMRMADDMGIELEATYTAKTFSHALRLAQSAQVRNILYWHTLSNAKCPFLDRDIPTKLESLWLPPS